MSTNLYEGVDDSIKEGIDNLLGTVIGHKTDSPFERATKQVKLAKAGINIIKVLTGSKK